MAGRPWRGRVGMTGLAVLVGLAGLALVWTALAGPGQPPTVPTARAHRAASSLPRLAQPRQPARRETSPQPAPVRHQHGLLDRISGPELPESKPVRVEIPRLHVTSHLVELGIDATGAMEVPADPAVAGWYDRGPTPGALGPAVIAGHVTWNRVPAVFFRLGTMRRGDVVRVARRDRSMAVFAVTRVARFGKASFPTRAVFGNIDHAGLRLITCGGRYDVAHHRYLANIVVFARLVASHPLPRAG